MVPDGRDIDGEFYSEQHQKMYKVLKEKYSGSVHRETLVFRKEKFLKFLEIKVWEYFCTLLTAPSNCSSKWYFFFFCLYHGTIYFELRYINLILNDGQYLETLIVMGKFYTFDLA